MHDLTLDPAQLRFDPPDLPIDVIARVLREEYGLVGDLTRLDGERDQNTLVRTDDGRAFVLKIASPSEDPGVADLQCSALRHVAASDGSLGVPEVVPSREGTDIVVVDVGGAPAPTRLLTYLDGITFAEGAALSFDALVEVGSAPGRLARALGAFDHPAATNFMAWSLDSGMIHHPQLWAELSGEGRAAAAPVRDRVESAVAALDGLRRQVLHNDGHRGNLLRTDPTSSTVTGVIDFGDITETAVVADLAVCIASFVDLHPDQPAAAAALTRGYHRWMPLEDDEIELLPDLVLARIVLGTLLVEFQARHAPEHRMDEIAGELPALRANMAAWGSLDVSATVDVLRSGLREHPTERNR